MAQGTGTPKVTVNVTSRNLRRAVRITDGVAGIIGTAVTVALIGKVNSISSYDDAIDKGYTPMAEPFLNAAIQQFYNEIGGNMKIWIMGVEDTMTMQQMVTATNANGLKKLLATAKGEITLVGVCRQPAESYDPGNGFLDKDVENALVASPPLCQYQQSINRPVRLLIEGRVVDVEAEPFAPNTANNGYAGVVLGNDIPDGTAAIGAALGRLCKYPAHIKAGSGENGALTLTAAYIGDKPIDADGSDDPFWYPEELDDLSDLGYFMLTVREGQAGYYWGVDNMATADDFRIMVHGRLIDKAHRIITANETPNLETSVRITNGGKINENDAIYTEEKLTAAILAGMNGQISNAQVILDPDQDIINTSTAAMEAKILPLGYKTWIAVTLGLTNSISS